MSLCINHGSSVYNYILDNYSTCDIVTHPVMFTHTMDATLLTSGLSSFPTFDRADKWGRNLRKPIIVGRYWVWSPLIASVFNMI